MVLGPISSTRSKGGKYKRPDRGPVRWLRREKDLPPNLTDRAQFPKTWKKGFLLWTHVSCVTATLHIINQTNPPSKEIQETYQQLHKWIYYKMSVLHRQMCPYTQCDHNSFHLDFERKELVLRNDTTTEELRTLIGKWRQKDPIAKGPMYKTVPPGTQTGPCTQCTTKAGHRQHDPDSAAITGKGKAPKSKLHRKRDGANHSYSKLILMKTELPMLLENVGLAISKA